MSKQLELKILEFLFFVKAIKRKEISMLFNDSVNLRSIQVSVKSLIDRKYTEQIKYKKANYLKITEVGINYLESKLGTSSIAHEDHIPFSASRYSVYSVEIMTYMKRVGLPTLPTEKPSFPFLISYLQHSPTIHFNTHYKYPSLSTGQIYSMLVKGIFYSSSEVKEYFKFENNSQVINRARFLGVILLKDRFIACYHVRNGLIRIYTESESTFISMIKRLYGINHKKIRAGCLAIGNVPFEIGLAAMATGRKNGEGKLTANNREFLSHLPMLDHRFIGGENEYDDMYYLPYGKDISLFETIYLTPDKIYEVSSNWLKEINRRDLFASTVDADNSITAKNRLSSFLIPCPEVSLVHRFFGYSVNVNIVTYTQLAEAIAKVLGPVVRDIYSLTDTSTLKFTRYNSFGQSYLNVENEKPKKSNHSKLLISINDDLINLVKEHCKSNEITISGYIRNLILQDLGDISAFTPVSASEDNNTHTFVLQLDEDDENLDWLDEFDEKPF